MLVLSRKPEQSIVLDNRIRIHVLQVRGNTVRLGIEAPPEVTVLRSELMSRGGSAGRRTGPDGTQRFSIAAPGGLPSIMR